MKIGVAISGGGSKGAHSVGVINAIRTLLNPEFSIVSGTSTGSLIGTLIATRQWQRLNAIYSNVKTSDIVKPRHDILGIDLGVEISFFVSAITGSQSIMTTDGLQNLIDSTIPDFEVVKGSQTLLLYTATELQSGKAVAFDNRITDPKDLRDALVASANQPTLMEPITIKGKQYVDGGVTEYLPLSQIFKRPESDELDLIISVASSPLEAPPVEEKYKESLAILGRAIELFGAEVASGDVLSARAINIARSLYDAICNKTNLGLSDLGITKEEEIWISNKKQIPTLTITPTRHIDEMTSLDFDPKKMKNLIKEGERDARNALKAAGYA